MIARYPAHRIVLELTEHAAIADYSALNAMLSYPRSQGLRIAVDDTGAGYASMKHILQLRPDIIKLDRSLTTGIADDSARQAMATFLVSFSREVGARVIAEGIETEQELSVLASCGVEYGQGYHLGRPAPLTGTVVPAALLFPKPAVPHGDGRGSRVKRGMTKPGRLSVQFERTRTDRPSEFPRPQSLRPAG